MNKSPKFWDNFRLNLHLSTVIKEWKSLEDIDWNNISPELRESVNRVSRAIKDCLELSNSECKNNE